MIVPPKKDPVNVKFRWDETLADDIKMIAEKTGRSMNETGEMLMRWAVERAKAELEFANAQAANEKKRSK